jgi:hypothetical protein
MVPLSDYKFTCVEIEVAECHPDAIKSKAKLQELMISLSNVLSDSRDEDCHIVKFGASDGEGFLATQRTDKSFISGIFLFDKNIASINIFTSQKVEGMKISYVISELLWGKVCLSSKRI